MHVEAEQPPLAQVQGATECRRTRLGHDQLRRSNRQRFGDSPFARQRFVENTVNESTKIPFRRVDELCARRIGGRILKHHRDFDDDLITGRDNWKIIEREYTADIVECMRHRQSGVLPNHCVADKCEVDTGRVQVVSQYSAMQSVNRSCYVDDRGRGRIE